MELLGFTPGTPEYDRELRRLKVDYCKMMQNVSSCQECSKFDECELRLAYWRDLVNPER